MAAIRWGLPPATPEVRASDIRSSYSFDEDDILTPLSFTQPQKFDFDPRQYQWGTLHMELVLLSLELSERIGYLHQSWRMAYYNLVPQDFERVYAVGRMVTVCAALCSLGLMYLLALEYVSRWAALWAAMLVAVSPAHLLGSVQIRADMTMTALLILAAWLGVRAHKSDKPAVFLLLGMAAGASIAAKYTAVFLAIPLLVVALWTRRLRLGGFALLGVLAGFLLGEPYMLIQPVAIMQKVWTVVQASHAIPNAYRIPVVELLQTHAAYLIRFLLGVPAALLAAAGIVILLRRRRAADWIPLVMLAGGIASFAPLLWPMLRYHIPLLPFLALAAAMALDQCPGFWPVLLGGVALIMPLAASIDQLHFMRSPHPANLMLPVVLQRVPPGTPIARPMPELPPLDRKVYPMGQNPLMGDLTANPPAWVVMTDLPLRPYPSANIRLLNERYDRVADFSERPRFPWATLGSDNSPHDWKYTHFSLTLYRHRIP